MAAAASQTRDDSPAPAASIDDTQAEVVAACLRKMKCLPGSVKHHGTALRGLAAIGRGEEPAAGDAPSAMSLVELEAALRDAGSALLEQAGLLAGQHERSGVCAALQYLSFRCFCAVDVLHQAVSGVGVDAVPEGDALWGAIVGAWGSVRSGVNVEGALADLTRWWQGFEGGEVDVAGEGGPVTHDAGGEVAADAALAGMRQQAEWLRGEAAGDLRSESAAVHLESAASAVEELRGLLGCGQVMSGRKVRAVGGLDLSGGVECLSGKNVSVYSGRIEIVDEDVGGAEDVEQWAGSVEAGATALTTSVGAVKRGEATRIAHGLPRMAQTPHRAALAHSSTAGRADEPIGERSSVTVQVQCEAGWPLRVFLEDEAWGDVGLDVKQRVAVRVLGVCAVAEACGVELSGVGVGSFVVVGVGSGSVGDLVVALDGGGCEVVLSACVGVWGKGRSHDGSGDGEGGGVLSVLREVLGVEGGALGGRSGVGSLLVGSGEGGEHALSSALEVLARGGSGCCMGAYAMACEASEGRAKCLSGVESVVRSLLARHQTTDGTPSHSAAVSRDKAPPAAMKSSRPHAEISQHSEQGVDHENSFHAHRTGSCLRESPNTKRPRPRRVGHITRQPKVMEAQKQESEPRTAGASEPDPGRALGRFSRRNTAAFVEACKKGNLVKVGFLLAMTEAREVDVHATDFQGREAAFRAACAQGHTDIVRELLDLTGAREVDVHAPDLDGPEAAFRYACILGHIDVVRELLALAGAREVDEHAAGGERSEAAFRGACQEGHTDIVRELLALTGAREVDVHARDCDGPEAAFRGACKGGHTDIVRELLGLTGAREVYVRAADDRGPEAAFRDACRNGHTDIVGELLGLTGAREVDVHAADRDGPEAAFRLACGNGHTDIVRELLGLAGARAVDVHAADQNGPEAAFRLACANGHTDIVRDLLSLTGAREVDVHAADGDGPEAAFRWACRNGRKDVVRELLVVTGHRRIPDCVRQRAAKFENLAELI